MTQARFVITTRQNARDGSFVAEPGPTRFLRVDADATSYRVSDAIPDSRKWRGLVAEAARRGLDPISGMAGDVLIFVHGYNNTIDEILRRTKLIKVTLAKAGWKGTVVAFDWPSDNSTLNYLEDRRDGASVAGRIVTDVLPVLIDAQGEKDESGRARCEINVHLLGHSTGAYVITEAFSFSEKIGTQFRSDYRIGQVALIGGDVSASSLDVDSAWAGPMFGRIDRLTNYSNGYDRVLAVSNAKRLGTAPRVGRVGLTGEAHPKAVNVDCAAYYETKDPDKSNYVGTFCHSWHIGDSVFATDLAMTLEGQIDRVRIPSRSVVDGRLVLAAEGAKRPQFQRQWEVEGRWGRQ